MNKNAIIVLHEIYGVNSFIESVCNELKSSFDVICPNMLNRKAFAYCEADKAYRYFQTEVGFEKSKDICAIGEYLKKSHEKVFALGFSVGATIAWKCSENPIFDGIVGFYGSRIRDFMSIEPHCRTLLIFAEKDRFHVDKLISELKIKPNLDCIKFKAEHGFADPYSSGYNEDVAIQARIETLNFLRLDELKCQR